MATLCSLRGLLGLVPWSSIQVMRLSWSHVGRAVSPAERSGCPRLSSLEIDRGWALMGGSCGEDPCDALMVVLARVYLVRSSWAGGEESRSMHDVSIARGFDERKVLLTRRSVPAPRKNFCHC